MDTATFLVQCLNAVQYGLLLFLVASGLTLIFGIMRVVNFAHGEFLMLGMYLAFWSFALLRLDPWFVLFVSIPIFFGVGFLTYARMERAFRALGLRARFLRSRGPLVWRLRRQMGRLRLGRQPAAFGVWVAQ